MRRSRPQPSHVHNGDRRHFTEFVMVRSRRRAFERTARRLTAAAANRLMYNGFAPVDYSNLESFARTSLPRAQRLANVKGALATTTGAITAAGFKWLRSRRAPTSFSRSAPKRRRIGRPRGFSRVRGQNIYNRRRNRVRRRRRRTRSRSTRRRSRSKRHFRSFHSLRSSFKRGRTAGKRRLQRRRRARYEGTRTRDNWKLLSQAYGIKAKFH